MIPFSISFDPFIIQIVHLFFARRQTQPLELIGLTFDPVTVLWIDSQGDIADEDAVMSLFKLTDEIYFPWMSNIIRLAEKDA
jgi:hypothetical protein